jgi:3-oxoacyl-[acyl-carrier protein] reductase
MDLQLAGKVAIVTGASRGIGRAIARVLADEGMRLAIVARSDEELRQVAASLPTESLAHVSDLRRAAAPDEAVAAAVARFGQLDLLVNNAGATKRGDFFELSDADWEDGFALKFYAAMRGSRAAWPHLKASRGSIVNIVGIGGRTGSADFTIGGAVNAAVLNLTKALADRGIADGIRVNAINPGMIRTGRLQTRLDAFAVERSLDPIEAERQMGRALGVARFGEPEDIARLVAFLASSAAGNCQGAIVDADGGQTRTL